MYVLVDTQPIAKACVGLIQAWMIFELAMRFRTVNIHCLNFWKSIVMVLTVVSFLTGSITVSVILLKVANGGNIMIEDE